MANHRNIDYPIIEVVVKHENGSNIFTLPPNKEGYMVLDYWIDDCFTHYVLHNYDTHKKFKIKVPLPKPQK